MTSRLRRRAKGGVYVIRMRKPGAIIGLPLVGRHFGYVGLTGSFKIRKKQHFEGDCWYNLDPKVWNDLDPSFYPVIPLPDWKWLMEAVESIVIALTCPVYNVRKQPPWNMRKISPAQAGTQRRLRDKLGLSYLLMRFVVRAGLVAVVCTAGVIAYRMTK